MNRLALTLACLVALAAPAAAQPRVIRVGASAPSVSVTRVNVAQSTAVTSQVRISAPAAVRPMVAPTIRWEPRTITLPVRPAPAPEPIGQGTFTCSVTENGSAAGAIVLVRQGSRIVTEGPCIAPTRTLAAGTYDVTIRLSGLVDAPEQFRRVVVTNGGAAEVSAAFETARLTVELLHDGQRIPGRATLLRDGYPVGTIGSGVYTHLSAGHYTVRVEVAPGFAAASGTRDYDVVLGAGQARRILASF